MINKCTFFLPSGHPQQVLYRVVFLSVYKAGHGSKQRDLQDPAAMLTPVGPGSDSLPLDTVKSCCFVFLLQ